jgi:hypothetical protein
MTAKTGKSAAIVALLRKLLCRHRHGFLLSVEWDGETIYQCAACGKHVRKPL